MAQQVKAIEFIQNDDDFDRVVSMMDSIRRYYSDMPSNFTSKEEIASFLESKLGVSPAEVKDTAPVVESKPVPETKAEPVVEEEIKTDAVEEIKESKTIVKKVPSKEKSKKPVVGKTVKIDQESIDSLMNVAGELLVAKNSLTYLADGVVTMTHDVIKREIMEK